MRKEKRNTIFWRMTENSGHSTQRLPGDNFVRDDMVLHFALIYTFRVVKQYFRISCGMKIPIHIKFNYADFWKPMVFFYKLFNKIQYRGNFKNKIEEHTQLV